MRNTAKEVDRYLTAAVVDKLYRPASVVLDPDEDDASDVTRRQLLIRLVPANKHHLSTVKTTTRHSPSPLSTATDGRYPTRFTSSRSSVIDGHLHDSATPVNVLIWLTIIAHQLTPNNWRITQIQPDLDSLYEFPPEVGSVIVLITIIIGQTLV